MLDFDLDIGGCNSNSSSLLIRRLLLFIAFFVPAIVLSIAWPRPLWAASVSTTITPSTQDSYLKQDAAGSHFGTKTTMHVRSQLNANRRSVIQFDLTTIPAGVKIEAASLQLFMYTTPGTSRVDNVYRILYPWTETGVCWRDRQSGLAWTNPGGDYSTTLTASSPTGTTRGWVSFDVSGDAQSFIDGAYANYGWLIKDSVEDAATYVLHSYRTKENTTVNNRPQLVVTYMKGAIGLSPTAVSAGSSQTFTIDATNTAGAAGDQIHQMTFTIPAGYTNIPTTTAGYTITAPGTKSWTVTGLPTGSNGPQTVTVTAATAADDLANSENLQVSFNVTAPTAAGLTTWTSSLVGAAGGVFTPPSINVDVTDSTPPDTTIGNPTGGTLTGANKLITGGATDNVAVNTVDVALVRAADGYYWDGANSTWTAGAVWNAATITSGQGTTSAAWQYNWSLPSDNGGSYTIKARATDGGGNLDPTPASVGVAVDNTPPLPQSFYINNDATYTVSNVVTLDAGATQATQMRFAETTAALASATYVSYNSTSTFTLSGGDGAKTVYAQYRDAAGNETTPAAANTSDSVMLDTTAPLVDTVSPPNGSSAVGPSTTVTASFMEAGGMDATTINSANFYLLDSGGKTVTATVTYNPGIKTAVLTPQSPLTQGMTYTAEITTAVKDKAGNSLTAPYSWGFTVADSIPPDTGISDPTGGTLTGAVKLITGTATDNDAVSSVKTAIKRVADGRYWDSAGSTWTVGAVWNAATITSGQGTSNAAWQFSWSLPDSDGGNFTIQAYAQDSGGNVDPTPVSASVAVDNIAPAINNFSLNNNDTYTNTATVTIDNSVTAAVQMRFAETTAALAAATYISYNSTSTFTLSGGDGTNTVYAQYRDAAGNETTIGQSGSHDSIILDTTKPLAASTFPADGAVGVNVTGIITAVFTETNQMDAATLNNNSFYLKDSAGTTVTAAVSYDAGSKTVSLAPAAALSYDTTYTAHITTAAADAAGNTLAAAKIWSFRTAPLSTHPPGTPQALSVTAGDMVNNLSWLAPSPGSDAGGDFDPANNQGGYNIYRATSPNGPWTKLNGALVLTNSFNDVSYGAKGYYYYTVRAVDLGGSAGASATVAYNRYVDMSKADSGLVATTLDAANGLISLSIPAQSSVTTISVRTLTTTTPAGAVPVTDVFELKPSGTNFSAPLTLTLKTPGDPTGAVIKFWDGSSWRQVSGGSYTYDAPNHLISYDNITHFSYYTVTNNNDSTPPSAPATLTVSAPADGQLKLDWGAATDLESGINGYIIYRSLSSFDNSTKGGLAQVIATPGNVLTYTDNDVIKGETYYYAVAAENGAGLEGVVGNVASGTVSGKENAHTGYNTNTNLCRDCHKLHEAPATVKKLLRKAPEIENCYVCHDGTGSDYNIRTDFENKAAHDTSMTVSTGGVATKCTECHSPHGIGGQWMTRLNQEELCYKCHNSSTSSANGWNVQQQFSEASRHSVTTTTADGLSGVVLECTSCHGPHGNKAGAGISDITARLSDPFNTYNLWSGGYNDFCISCHRGGGRPVATATISVFVPYSIAFPTVGAYPFFPGWDKSAYTGGPAGHSGSYTCQTCHAPHGSPNKRLRAYFDGSTYNTTASAAREENLCYQCHKVGGPTGAKDLQSQFAKASRHPVETTGTHSDLDTTATLGDGSRHAECSDCHDVHKAQAGLHSQGNNTVSGVLSGVVGVAVTNGSAGTTPTYSPTVISYEYELCFKCHSSYVNLPFGAKDKSVEFNSNNPSYHPVESTGTNTNISPAAFANGWTATSKMYCSDCHTTDDAVSTTTPSGPHGSAYTPILKANFNKYDGNNGGNDLCYECHSYSAYFGASSATRFWDDTTTTSEHKTHVGDRKEPCYACHDTHGRSDNAHLIRIKESGETTGTTSFTHNSAGGACQATCHNQPLVDYTYKHKY